MRAVAGQVAERLGHVGRDRAVLVAAIWLVIILKNVYRSAVVRASAYFQFSSNWAVPSSWSDAYGSQPRPSIARTSSRR